MSVTPSTDDRPDELGPTPTSEGGGVWRATAILAVIVLIPSLLGFGAKFLELIAAARQDDEGAFAIMPIVNYLLASLGFLWLFGWAIAHGMFRDLEAPKYLMLERERMLDAAEESR